MQTKILIDLDVPPQDVLTEEWRKAEPAQLAKMMGPELQNFSDWFIAQGQQPLLNVELTILKTYLAWKIKS